MKMRIKKRRVSNSKLPKQFVIDTLHAIAEAKAGKTSPYQFGSIRKRYTAAELVAQCDPKAPISEDLQAWDHIVPVGREFGSKGYERFTQLDALADAAKAAADRASDSIDETRRFVEESNNRINALEERK